MRFREVREIKTVEKKKKVIPSQYLIDELNRYFDEIDREDVVMSKLDMIKNTFPEQLDEMLHENLKRAENIAKDMENHQQKFDEVTRNFKEEVNRFNEEVDINIQ